MSSCPKGDSATSALSCSALLLCTIQLTQGWHPELLRSGERLSVCALSSLTKGVCIEERLGQSKAYSHLLTAVVRLLHPIACLQKVEEPLGRNPWVGVAPQGHNLPQEDTKGPPTGSKTTRVVPLNLQCSLGSSDIHHSNSC